VTILKTVDPDEVLANVDKLKQLDHKFFSIGLTHHFYNEMVGHAKSLSGIVSKFCDQKDFWPIENWL